MANSYTTDPKSMSEKELNDAIVKRQEQIRKLKRKKQRLEREKSVLIEEMINRRGVTIEVEESDGGEG